MSCVADFNWITLIGKGGFGKVRHLVFYPLIQHQVYLTTRKSDGQQFAIKVFKKSFLVENERTLRYIISEREIMASVSHPFIVTLHNSFQDQGQLYLVMDFIRGGAFGLHLQGGALDEDTARFYMAQIALAVDHLHSSDIVHR